MIRKTGLVHGPERWEVEDVTNRHRTPCTVCGILPRGRRLLIVAGAGRVAVRRIYCDCCAQDALEERAGLYRRALRYLRREVACVRKNT